MTHSSQNQTGQIDAIQSPAPVVCHEHDDTAHFYELWTALPSWSPIIKKANGWITIVNSSGKKVPLVLGTVESHYRRHIILGKRFGKLTNYLMIDIDINSPFHPRNGGIDKILAAMESLGLCRFLLIRSSVSEGIHVYFPLAEPVSSWAIACAAHAALTAAGVTIAGGTCELFPNKRAFNAEHNGHRLPLQTGSFLLDKDFCPISNHKADFVSRWETAATHQDNQTLQQALSGNAVYALPSTPVEPPPAITAPQRPLTTAERITHVVPPIAWTRYGQSNDIMRELANYGDRYAGHRNSTALAAWITAVAPLLSGYQQFASPKSKRDIEDGSWAKRWAESHFRSKWLYGVSGPDHNANIAADAKYRIFAALERMCIDTDITVTQLWKQISKTAKCCFNVGVGWKTLDKYRDEIWAVVKRYWKLGLSSGRSEDINSFPEAQPAAQIIESEPSAEKGYTQLLTLRCVVDIYSSAFAQLYTPKNEVDAEGRRAANLEAKLPDERVTSETTRVEAACSVISAVKDEGEGDIGPVTIPGPLTVGQAVRIVMPGGSLDGIETQVLAQALDVLGQPVYRLDYLRHGQAVTLPVECLQVVEGKERALPGEKVIRATAAQLLQVLGQACPFVGPGLWTVKRDEVPAKAWGQLCSLVGRCSG
ncbi:MAG: hypothetical protein AAFW84_30470 [Cyanobacteria bacterium J06635_15]